MHLQKGKVPEILSLIIMIIIIKRCILIICMLPKTHKNIHIKTSILMRRAPSKNTLLLLLAISFLLKGHKRPEIIVEWKSGKVTEMVQKVTSTIKVLC